MQNDGTDLRMLNVCLLGGFQVVFGGGGSDGNYLADDLLI